LQEFYAYMERAASPSDLVLPPLPSQSRGPQDDASPRSGDRAELTITVRQEDEPSSLDDLLRLTAGASAPLSRNLPGETPWVSQQDSMQPSFQSGGPPPRNLPGETPWVAQSQQDSMQPRFQSGESPPRNLPGETPWVAQSQQHSVQSGETSRPGSPRIEQSQQDSVQPSSQSYEPPARPPRTMPGQPM
jgi:hypothetical protein